MLFTRLQQNTEWITRDDFVVITIMSNYHKLIPNDQKTWAIFKRKPFSIDLMADDTDSDSCRRSQTQPKLRNISREGRYSRGQSMRWLMIPFPIHDYDNPDCDPSALGDIDWCGVTPDAGKIRWQKKQREEKVDEEAIAYFQWEEADNQLMQRYLETANSIYVGPLPLGRMLLCVTNR